jgi:hypothetical protein
MKNISLSRKDITLNSALQSHFKGNFNLARVKLISLFIKALCVVKTINYDRLAYVFESEADKNSKFA